MNDAKSRTAGHARIRAASFVESNPVDAHRRLSNRLRTLQAEKLRLIAAIEGKRIPPAEISDAFRRICSLQAAIEKSGAPGRRFSGREAPYGEATENGG